MQPEREQRGPNNGKTPSELEAQQRILASIGEAHTRGWQQTTGRYSQ